MKVQLHQVVTFAGHIFHGNPAYVVVAENAPSDAAMVEVCELIAADVIAVIVNPRDAAPRLAFYTAEGPHAGAGHATLAAAHVALAESARETLSFTLANGEIRRVNRSSHGIAVTWPVMAYEPSARRVETAEALRADPRENYVSPFGYVAIFETAAEIAALKPDMARLAALDRSAVIATAPGIDSDIVIRVFAPAVGLPEDPVCGTAHRIITPYWSGKLGKTELHSRHLSRRGGDLWCKAAGSNVEIAGASIEAFAAAIELPS